MAILSSNAHIVLSLDKSGTTMNCQGVTPKMALAILGVIADHEGLGEEWARLMIIYATARLAGTDFNHMLKSALEQANTPAKIETPKANLGDY